MIDFKKRKTQTTINLLSSIVSLGLNLGINFFLSPYIVANLGAEANGYTQLANNFIMYASLITIAFNSMSGRFISIAYHKNDYVKANQYYSSTILANIAIVIILILPSIFCIWKLENLINISYDLRDVKILFALCFANFFVGQLFSVFNVSTYVTNTLYLSNLVMMGRFILNAVSLILLFSLFQAKIYFVSMVGFTLTILYSLVMCRLKVILLKKMQFNIADFRFSTIVELVSSGFWNAVNQAGNILMTGFDLLLTNIFVSPVQMGILAVAKTVPTQIISLGTTVNNNFSPSLTMIVASGQKSELLAELRMAMKISSVIMSIPIMTFCVFGQSFYALWMPSLDSRQLVILSVLTCLAFIPASGTQALYNVFTSMNKLKFNSMTFLINGFLNIVIVYLCLSYTNLGVYAVAGVSSTTTILRILIFTLPYTAYLLELKWYTFYKDVGVSLACAVICFVIAFVIDYFVTPQTWFMLVICVAVTCVLSLIGQMYLLLNKQERTNLINKLLRRKTNG